MTAQKRCTGIFALFLLALATARLDAQVLYGSIVGAVTDPSGAVVPNAQVKAVNPATGKLAML